MLENQDVKTLPPEVINGIATDLTGEQLGTSASTEPDFKSERVRVYRCPVTDLDQGKQAMPCWCYHHEGQIINHKHTADCAKLDFDHSDGDTKEVVVVGPEQTSVVIWKPKNYFRKMEGLAQVRSNDPIAYARKQIEEAERSLFSAPYIPLPELASSEQRPTKHYPDTTKFIMDWVATPWYFRWLAKPLHAILFIAALLGYKPRPKSITRRVVLSKSDLIARLAEVTAGCLNKAERQIATTATMAVYSKRKYDWGNPDLQAVLRFSKVQ